MRLSCVIARFSSTIDSRSGSMSEMPQNCFGRGVLGKITNGITPYGLARASTGSSSTHSSKRSAVHTSVSVTRVRRPAARAARQPPGARLRVLRGRLVAGGHAADAAHVVAEPPDVQPLHVRRGHHHALLLLVPAHLERAVAERRRVELAFEVEPFEVVRLPELEQRLLRLGGAAAGCLDDRRAVRGHEVGGALLHEGARVVEAQRALAGAARRRAPPPLVVVEELAVAREALAIALREGARERGCAGRRDCCLCHRSISFRSAWSASAPRAPRGPCAPPEAARRPREAGPCWRARKTVRRETR